MSQSTRSKYIPGDIVSKKDIKTHYYFCYKLRKYFNHHPVVVDSQGIWRWQEIDPDEDLDLNQIVIDVLNGKMSIREYMNAMLNHGWSLDGFEDIFTVMVDNRGKYIGFKIHDNEPIIPMKMLTDGFDVYCESRKRRRM